MLIELVLGEEIINVVIVYARLVGLLRLKGILGDALI